MYSITINCKDAKELSAVAAHLSALDTSAPKRTAQSEPAAEVSVPVADNAPRPPKAKTEKPKAEKPKEEENTANYDQVREATFKLAGLPGEGPRLVKEVLGRFGVDHATKLTEKQWQSYIDEATKAYDKNKPEENLA